MDLSKSMALQLIRTQFGLLGALSKKEAARRAFNLFTTPQSRVLHPHTPLFQKADALQFVLAGGAVHGFRWGRSDKKVLILHGYESSVVNFGQYVEPLLAKGYEVLAFNAPAHGRSEGLTINVLDYQRFILHILQSFGPVTSFITHSFGGLALSLALECLPHNETWKVVFIAPATETTRAVDNYAKLVRLSPAVREELEGHIQRINNKPASWYSLTRAAAAIKAQVLFLQDKQDTLTPLTDVEPLMAKGYPNFQFRISDGLGHSRIYRDPSTVESVIRFL